MQSAVLSLINKNSLKSMSHVNSSTTTVINIYYLDRYIWIETFLGVDKDLTSFDARLEHIKMTSDAFTASPVSTCFSATFKTVDYKRK